jgi:hypothetical protein
MIETRDLRATALAVRIELSDSVEAADQVAAEPGRGNLPRLVTE